MNVLFLLLFAFRYARFIVHAVTGIFLYKPAVSARPRYTSRNVAVIIPTVAPNTAAFLACCLSVLANEPHTLIIATVGKKLLQEVNDIIKTNNLETRFPHTQFLVVKTSQANKRKQVVLATEHLDRHLTPVTVCVDDHVYWQPTFLTSLLPAFDDPKVGLVGTNKRVIRDTKGGLWASYVNFIACLYLERHNFQIRSEGYLDGSVFVVSGRTAATRTEILQNRHFRRGYQDEMFFFGRMGPLNPDDDNYGTRWVLRNGWKIRIQQTRECQVVTPLGDPAKFFGQVLR